MYSLGLDPGNVDVKVQADPTVGLPHGSGNLPCGLLPLAQGKYGWPRAGYATAQGPGRKGIGLNGIKTWNKDGAYGLHDHILEGTSDKLVILLKEAGDQTAQIPPLLDSLFH